MAVRELVGLGRQPHTGWTGRLAAADHLAVDQALAATGADQLAHRRVVELSDGELQRVTIARALAQETPILFLDEATAHLDVRGRAAIADCLRAQARRGRLVVAATHDLELALGVADRLLVLEPGRASLGLAEDLALSGVLDRALGGGELLLDPVRGGFFAPGQNRGRIALVGGDPQSRAWTTRALARVGLNVHEAAGSVLAIETGAWILPGGARAESLAAVVRALGNLGADAEVEEP
jgi:iron complex transport system ATP-binding protein